jgi:hypothetical protein
MNHTRPFRPIRRLAGALAALAAALLTTAAAGPAAFAAPTVPPPVSGPPAAAHLHQLAHQAPAPVPVHTIVVGGMPGWQIALIAAAAALLAATVAVLADRARTARRQAADPAA